MRLVPFSEEDDHPWTQEMKRSRRAMQRVLTDKKLTKRQKVKHHAREFGKYLVFHKKRQRNRGRNYFLTAVSAPEAGSGTSVTDLVRELPLEYQDRASRVLAQLQEYGIVTWDDKGGVFVDGVRIPRANLVRLIREMVVKRGTSRRKPVGWDRFLSAAEESEVAVLSGPADDPDLPPPTRRRRRQREWEPLEEEERE